MGTIDKFNKAFPYYLILTLALSFTGISAYQYLKEDSKYSVQKDEDENLDNMADFHNAYNEYVHRVAFALKYCTGERDLLKDYALYMTMFEHGFMSLGDFSRQGRETQVIDSLGANVASGKGYYVNEANNLACVLNVLGYDAKPVVGTKYIESEEYDYEKPEDPNYMLVYVHADGIDYLLDPANKTIFLRSGWEQFYSLESSEGEYVVFDPTYSYSDEVVGKYTNYDLFGVKNSFKKHWDILKTFRGHLADSEQYLKFFRSYEIYCLENLERRINFELLKYEKEQLLATGDIADGVNKNANREDESIDKTPQGVDGSIKKILNYKAKKHLK